MEILRQVNNPDYKGLNFSQSVKKFWQTQGIKGLMKGNSASLSRILPFSSIEFYSFEFYKNNLIRGYPDRQNNVYYTFLCGILTGFNSITITFPLDVARTRLACHTSNSSEIKEGSLTRTIIGLWKESGIKGLYKGYPVVLIVRKIFV